MKHAAATLVACALAAGAGCNERPSSAIASDDAGVPVRSDASDASTTKAKPKDAGPDASPLVIPASCAGMLQPPTSLECTGLYTDMALKTVAPQLHAYTPAVPLWADGSSKLRWIYFPPGQQIDTTNPSEWTFPVGTRVWKEFSRDNIRVETRFFEKTAAATWAYGTYQWNTADASAMLAPGGDFMLPDGQTYHIPTTSECGQCHDGRLDRLMGFEQVSLGLSGATGMTLDELVKENLLSPAPKSTHLEVGDDGTGLAAAPLSWLHINCGVSCHNTNEGATAYGAGMVLRLDPTQLDGRPSNPFPSLVTTVGVAGKVITGTRIVAGNAQASLLYQLINERGSIQMPPIASLYIDTPDVATIASWIAAMPPAAVVDAGTDAAVDAAKDSGVDASHLDASMHDGGARDATEPTDAKTHDGDEDGEARDGARDAGASEAGDAANG